MSMPGTQDSTGRSLLLIGGTDPLCGAGVFADVLVAHEEGMHAAAFVTATVDQQSGRVYGWAPTCAATLQAGITRALAAIDVGAVKIGMLGSAATARAVFSALRGAPEVPVVLDPVLRSGADDTTPLSETGVCDEIRAFVDSRVLVTPNANELKALLGAESAREITVDIESTIRPTQVFCAGFGGRVLVKGGHFDPPGTDVLVCGTGELRRWSSVPWPHQVRGTGCHLSTLVAAGLAQGDACEEAIAAARQRLTGHVVSGNVTCPDGGRLQFDHRRRDGTPS